MISVRLATALFASMCMVSSVALGDAPDTQPSEPPYALIVPPGMQKVTAGGYTAIVPPEYVAAAQAGLAKYTPATRPTTEPSDMLARLANARASLLTEMAADLSIPQDKAAAFLDGDLKKTLSDMAALHSTVYVIVATQDQLNAAGRSGWTAPLFHYNILADREFYSPHILVSTSHPMGDVVLWCEPKPGGPDEAISSAVALCLREFEGGFSEGAAQDAVYQTRLKIAKFIETNAIAPLNLPTSEQWFGLGVEGAQTAKYAAEITGISRGALSKGASEDGPNNPLMSSQLDLLHGFDSSSVKPDYLAVYMDAVSRKGTKVVQKLIDQGGGDAAVSKILAAIRSSPPPDNVSLVKLIQDTTGLDLTNDLLPPPL